MATLHRELRALVIQPGALKLSIPEGGGAVRAVFIPVGPHNVTSYGDLLSGA